MTRKLFFACVFCALSGVMASGAQQPVGGYSPVAVTDKDVIAAAIFAVDTQRRAMHFGEPFTRLELVELTGAEQQVVSGIKYRLELKVKLDGGERDAEAVVWWQAWRKPEPYQLGSWRWKSHQAGRP